MRVAVLGAGGMIAPAIVRDLAGSEEVGSMLLLDLDGERASAVATAHGGGKATAEGVDARGDLAARLAAVDVLVNSAAYRVNLAAMRACLEAGCHYMDLGGLYHVTSEQLLLSAEFEDAGLLALLGIGSAPGKTNLMASQAVSELGGEVESIAVSAAGRDLDPPPGLSVPYSLQTLVDEVSKPPIVLRDGLPDQLAPLTDGPRVDFGGEIGESETIFTLHSEIRTFGESFGCSSASFALSLVPPLIDKLRELAGAPEELVSEVARTASPSSPRTVAVHLVEVVGADHVITIRSFTGPHLEWGLGGGVVSTASPAAAAVRLLARGGITARGAIPPERCIAPAELFAELAPRGIVLSRSERARADHDDNAMVGVRTAGKGRSR